MPAQLDPLKRVKCTFKDCAMSFDTEKEMKGHKKYSDEHEYCHKCDEDFEDTNEFILHKIIRPLEHNKACRVCGDEFKSLSGLRRHIELYHKVDQELTCIGCKQSFYRASLFIEHLEYNHCSVISATQFHNHVIHKHLVDELLGNNAARKRFDEKQAKYEATQDYDPEGGVSVLDTAFGDNKREDVKFKAIEPDSSTVALAEPTREAYPYLPSQGRGGNALSDLTPAFDSLELDENDASTVISSPTLSATPAGASQRGSVHGPSSTHGSITTTSTRESKVWGPRNGKSTSSVLFPKAKPTPVPDELSVARYDEQFEKIRGPNMLNTRFWDPASSDYNAERFYDAVLNKYFCPFICEQSFDSAGDMKTHIIDDHRIARVKCPMCLKYFKSVTALMAHCEARAAKCDVAKADDFGIFLDRFSGGFLAVQEKVRPDHLNNPTVLITNAETNRPEKYRPPVANYLEYKVTTPPTYKEPVMTKRIGGGW